MHVCSMSEELAREVARHTTSFVVAAARRLVLLRRLEWQGTRGLGTDADPVCACCPECGQTRDEGHTETCELGEEVAR